MNVSLVFLTAVFDEAMLCICHAAVLHLDSKCSYPKRDYGEPLVGIERKRDIIFVVCLRNDVNMPINWLFHEHSVTNESNPYSPHSH